jgi:hypothetical protein
VKNFIIYNVDGDILRTGRCLDIDFDKQTIDGEFIIEGLADPEVERITNGVVVVKSDSELASKEASEFMFNLKSFRNSLLSNTDWTQVPDSPLSDEERSKWATYRQQLRDLPSFYSTETNMSNVVFPEEP